MPDDRSPLAAFLANCDVPCPACGYNLRGVQSDRCPECSGVMELGVLAPRRPSRVGVLALVVLAGYAVLYGWGTLGYSMTSGLEGNHIALLWGASRSRRPSGWGGGRG